MSVLQLVYNFSFRKKINYSIIPTTTLLVLHTSIVLKGDLGQYKVLVSQ